MAIAVWVKLLALPMPPPGPCDANALAGSSSAAAMAARDVKEFFRDMTVSRDNRLRKATDNNGAGFEIFALKLEPARTIRIHLCGADIHSTFTSLALVLDLRCGDAAANNLPRDVAMSPPTQGEYT
jgi:hypothetical protein